MSGAIAEYSGQWAEVVAQLSKLPDAERELEIDDYITWVEDKLLDLPQHQVGYSHQFIDGLYIRTMLVPAGTTITGAIHKKGCLTLLLEGEISILTAKGAALLKAPMMFPAAAGIRRLGYCHTDVLCSTIHSVSSTNIDDVEIELFDYANPEV